MASTTEITSQEIASDNPVHQRLLRAYYSALDYVKGGSLLEIGCGVGRGIEILKDHFDSYTAVDKNKVLLQELARQYEGIRFVQAVAPDFSAFSDNTFDYVVSFQVIEHIRDDHTFLDEIHRMLKPGGKAIITTPNKTMSLTRNPWHIREYTTQELKHLCEERFSHVTTLGVSGNEKVSEYFEMNRKSVEKITRWDIFNLQYHLPAWIIRIPYEILNRINRNKLQDTDDSLVSSIHYSDYLISDKPESALDHFFILEK